MWTPDLVKIRFVEAAATERFLPTVRLGGSTGFWPVFIHSAEDVKGWDKKAEEDHLRLWQGRGAAKADAISRHTECLEWTSAYIKDDKRRKLVWAFAFCRANKWDFGKLCERKGWIKSTSYDRLNKLWDKLADEFGKQRLWLHMPSEYWVGHETANQRPICATVETRDAAKSTVPKSHIYEKSRDLIRTEQDAEAFAKHLARHNSKARREQERREAQLLKQIEAA